MSIEHGQDMYDMLGVKLTRADLDPESFYGGVPHPSTGETIGNQCKTMVLELLAGIADKKPVCKTGKHVVWPEGNGISTYTHCHDGISWVSSKEYDCHNKYLKPKYRHKESKGKLLSDGAVGLGLPYAMAVKIWGFDTVEALPEK